MKFSKLPKERHFRVQGATLLTAGTNSISQPAHRTPQAAPSEPMTSTIWVTWASVLPSTLRVGLRVLLNTDSNKPTTLFLAYTRGTRLQFTYCFTTATTPASLVKVIFKP